jgi:betaine lipid synthase
MDHLDWFPPSSTEVQEEVGHFKRVLAPGGMVFWRSASRNPWYNKVQVSWVYVLRKLAHLINYNILVTVSSKQAFKLHL